MNIFLKTQHFALFWQYFAIGKITGRDIIINGNVNSRGVINK